MKSDFPSTETAAENTDERRNWVEFVHFTLGDHSYEIELGRITQIVRNPAVTQVPQTGPTISGVTNFGGEIAVVIDGRAVLESSPHSADSDALFLLFDRQTTQPAGLLVDDVSGIEPHHIDCIKAPTESDTWDPHLDEHWFRAVVEDPDRTDQPIGVLDTGTIITEVKETV